MFSHCHASRATNSTVGLFCGVADERVLISYLSLYLIALIGGIVTSELTGRVSIIIVVDRFPLLRCARRRLVHTAYPVELNAVSTARCFDFMSCCNCGNRDKCTCVHFASRPLKPGVPQINSMPSQKETLGYNNRKRPTIRLV